LGAPLLLFILWQLFGQIVLAKQVMDFGHALAVDNAEFDAAFATYQQKNRKIQILLRRIWLPALIWLRFLECLAEACLSRPASDT
jgi:hypothetical protein